MIFILHCSLKTSERWTLSLNIKQSDSFSRKKKSYFLNDIIQTIELADLRDEPHHQGRS